MDLAEQIREAFAQEQLEVYEPTRRSDIPRSYEAITDAWLSDVLGQGRPDCVVIGHSLGEPDPGTSNRRRIYLQWNESGLAAGLPNSVFCKAAHGLENRLTSGHSGGIHCEVTFYNSVRELLDIEAPRSYHAHYDPVSFNSIIVLEDLGADVEFFSHRTKVGRDHIGQQLALLARLHGSMYASPLLETTLAALPTWFERFHNLKRFNLEVACERGVIDAGDAIPARLRKRAAEVWPLTLKSVERHLHLTHTLTHGDVHLKNWYRAPSGAIGLGDWQVTSRGHWCRDLAYTMSTALDIDARRAQERELIEEYLDRLASEGGERISFDDAFLLYRQQLLSALAFWTMTLSPNKDMPDMQPKDTSIAFIHRIAQAIDDLDALDSF